MSTVLPIAAPLIAVAPRGLRLAAGCLPSSRADGMPDRAPVPAHGIRPLKVRGLPRDPAARTAPGQEDLP